MSQGCLPGLNGIQQASDLVEGLQCLCDMRLRVLGAYRGRQAEEAAEQQSNRKRSNHANLPSVSKQKCILITRSVADFLPRDRPGPDPALRRNPVRHRSRECPVVRTLAVSSG